MPIYKFKCANTGCREYTWDQHMSLGLFKAQKDKDFRSITCPACMKPGPKNIICAPALHDISEVTVDGSNIVDPVELIGKTFKNKKSLRKAKKEIGITSD